MIEHHVGTSRRSSIVHLFTKAVARPTLKYCPLTGPVTKLMPLMEHTAALLPRLSSTAHEPVRSRTWRGEVVTPVDGPTSAGAILYLHGGAFLTCGLATHRRIVERLAQRSGMTVLAVDYRQLPHGRLHDSISDCEDAFGWLVRRGHPASRILLAGDSAGGHLAFATALRLRDVGAGTPAGIVAMSPWLDFDHLAKSKHRNACRDAYIPARRLRQVAEMVVGAHPELHHSPVNADLSGLPPSLIICAEGEVLRVDAELMTHRLSEAGVPCTLQIWEGQVHAFPVLTDLVPESSECLDGIVRFAEQVVAAPAYAGRRHLRVVGGASDVA